MACALKTMGSRTARTALHQHNPEGTPATTRRVYTASTVQYSTVLDRLDSTVQRWGQADTYGTGMCKESRPGSVKLTYFSDPPGERDGRTFTFMI